MSKGQHRRPVQDQMWRPGSPWPVSATLVTSVMVTASASASDSTPAGWYAQFPPSCGINAAIVHDLSKSLSPTDLAHLKAASTGFVDALAGTDSQVATFTFATNGPAAGSENTALPLTSVSTQGADVVKAEINGFNRPGGDDGGTNGDRGIHQVVTSGQHFNVVVTITDGVGRVVAGRR